ncbi:MAG: DEAD/DEAH box helicase, partial [Gemmatimonadetes bacterium]
RQLGGVIVPGSDHITAYNVYAEAVNKYGYLGEVYGLPRHLFREDEIERWAEDRGVLVKAIEDIALGTASVYRQLEVPLPAKLPYGDRKTLELFADLLAKIMPFDLVIDEQTADGQEARVSRSSVSGSWGAIAGSLRYFADRFGVPRASIEGTQIPERAIRRNARRGKPVVVFERQRRREGLMVVRTVDYFGFTLDRDVEPLPSPFPPELADSAREALVEGLLAGATPHPDQSRVRRALDRFGHYWRRSGGRLTQAQAEQVAGQIAVQLAGVNSWDAFINRRIDVDPNAAISESERHSLDALPSSVFLYGDRVPVDYDIEHGIGVVRLRLKEGQARRLHPKDLPVFDRPVRYTVTRGKHEAVRASSLEELRQGLRALGTMHRGRVIRGGRRPRRR